MPVELKTIESLLTTKVIGRAPGWANEVWETIDSTNNRAAELAFQGAPHGVIVLARQQTAGHGRHGRPWVSPCDAGIYASFLLRPQIADAPFPHTLSCGIAFARAIEMCTGIRPGIKWLNDLVFEGKKIGGILAESPHATNVGKKFSTVTSALQATLIVGVGINLRFETDQLPAELVNRTDWLERITNQPIDSNLLVAYMARELESVCELMDKGSYVQILDSWRKYSITLGRHVRVLSGNNAVEGLAVDIADNGGLIVKTADGQETLWHAGEVTIRGADNNYI